MSVHSPADVVCSRAELIGSGWRPRQITRAVRSGELIRVRRDHYLSRRAPGVEEAVRVGGRLACVSMLATLGVFVREAPLLHVHVRRGASRLRHPRSRRVPLRVAGSRGSGVRLHWSPLVGETSRVAVHLLDAVRQAVCCQSPRDAVATLDSVLHRGLLSSREVRDLFSSLPHRYRVILRLADGIAESGPETYMRLILRQLGLRFEAQVEIAGVGRVDFLVEGWLIIECDSKAHHEGWEHQRTDRRRDLAAATLGLTTFRCLAEDLFTRRAEVAAAVRGLVRAHR